MIDYHARRRQLWIARQSHDIKRWLSVMCGRKNQSGISQDELAYWISDRAAAVIVAVLIYGIFAR